jgi:dTDP-4-dehydrorhamnose reductase
MIHFSTDCVFTGEKGQYVETDLADARDTYGLSKFMGEVDYPHTLTLRTSIIGHELESNVSLVDWFLFYYKKTILHNGILAFKNQKRTIRVGDSPSLC